MTPNRLGLVIGALFGLVYVVVNARVLPTLVAVLLQVLGAVAFLGVLVLLWRARSSPASASGPERPGFGRGYWLVVVAEVAAIAAGNALLNLVLDLPAGVLPWITFVVGVHFLLLARVWREASLWWLGGGLAVLGAVGFGLAVAGAPDAAVATVAGVAAGALLLSGSVWAAAREGAGARNASADAPGGEAAQRSV